MTSRSVLWILLGSVVLLVVVAAVRSGGLATGNLDAGDWGSLVGLSMLAALSGASVMGLFRGRAGDALQAVIAWLAIFAFLGVIYTYRYEFEAVGRRVLANLVPGMGSEGVTGTREVTVPRGGGGTYVVRVTLNGSRATPMLVDTGASALVLTEADARRAGIRVEDLSFNVPVQTANGQSLTAATMVEMVAIGPIVERNVRALVARPGALTTSLLGHTFLDRLESYEVRAGRMVLRGRS
ncbi:MAG: TIGR02281 family clan AA aspartic protease [Phreatobacter sp.]|uniref:retropepsin-like aspartic protease family protein n=1 Tax=Phreatobacter sp. TaxID=1966341 RepID=UPI002733F3EB|nr:TIGR02281 family clan AA aspartic protease [Phreatobacter sp.]MDP2800748.1 TIGR02281 family clan AA aspartic protease [Phreatobacter sp.]